LLSSTYLICFFKKKKELIKTKAGKTKNTSSFELGVFDQYPIVDSRINIDVAKIFNPTIFFTETIKKYFCRKRIKLINKETIPTNKDRLKITSRIIKSSGSFLKLSIALKIPLSDQKANVRNMKPVKKSIMLIK
jgi:hypothetical protein